MFGLVLCWMLLASDQQQSSVQRKRYLDAVLVLKDRAERLETPAVIEDYTRLLTEFYSKQVGFRTFMLKNLPPGEVLSHTRKSHELISREETGVMIEKNLELLLLRAREKFPSDLQIEFSLAQYLVSGRCCYVSPKIKLSHAKILDIFKHARERGIISSTSLWTLAVDALASRKVDGALVSSLLEQSVMLNPFHEDAIYAYTNDLLKNQHYGLALDQAKNLFEITLDPAMKAHSLAAVARAYAAKNRCAESLKAVETALKFLPNHALAWMVGLGCLRRAGDKAAYYRLVRDFLNTAPENPSAFQTYLGYLELKGLSSLDKFVVASYENESYQSALARLTQRINLGKFYLVDKQWERAEACFIAGLDLLGELRDPPEHLEQTVTRLIQLAREGSNP